MEGCGGCRGCIGGGCAEGGGGEEKVEVKEVGGEGEGECETVVEWVQGGKCD